MHVTAREHLHQGSIRDPGAQPPTLTLKTPLAVCWELGGLCFLSSPHPHPQAKSRMEDSCRTTSPLLQQGPWVPLAWTAAIATAPLPIHSSPPPSGPWWYSLLEPSSLFRNPLGLSLSHSRKVPAQAPSSLALSPQRFL